MGGLSSKTISHNKCPNEQICKNSCTDRHGEFRKGPYRCITDNKPCAQPFPCDPEKNEYSCTVYKKQGPTGFDFTHSLKTVNSTYCNPHWT